MAQYIDDYTKCLLVLQEYPTFEEAIIQLLVAIYLMNSETRSVFMPKLCRAMAAIIHEEVEAQDRIAQIGER